MKKALTLAAVILLLTVSNSFGQRGNCRWNNNNVNSPRSGRNFNVATVKTITGEITAIDYINHGGRSQGVHLTVKTENGTIEAHLGPDWALDNNNVKVNKGDAVTLTGSMVPYNDTEAMAVSEVVIGDNKYSLRDSDGFPNWSRGPRGNRGNRGFGNRRF